MLKTRSLFPHYGIDLFGNYLGMYKYENPSYYAYLGSTEKILRYFHGIGHDDPWYSMSILSANGEEKFVSTENYYQDNCCDHFRVRRVNYPYTMGRYIWYGARMGIYTYCRIEPRRYAYPDLAEFTTAHAAALGKVGDELRAEAYWELRPKFEGEVSMLNFLFELKDFRSIAKLLTSTTKKNPLIRLLSTNTTKDASKLVKDSLSTPTKSLAEAHLVNSFAIQPLISDLTAIFQQLHQMVDDAQSRFSASGAGTTRRWSSQLDPVANLIPGTPEQQGYQYVDGSSRTSIFTAVAKMKYNYSPRSRFNAACAYWGFVPSAEAIWNGIPFSFLVDYFLSVGKSLRRMRTDPNLSAYTLSEYSESLLTSFSSGRYIATAAVSSADAQMGMIINDKYFLDINNTKPKLLDGWEVSHYTRWLNVQPYYGPALPKLLLPKTSQLLNMAALARCMF